MKRKTHEEFVADIATKHPTLKILGRYVNGRTRVNMQCMICGNVFSPIASSLYMGHGCTKCGKFKRRTHENFISDMNTINPNIEVLSKFTRVHDRIEIRRKKCGHEWNAEAGALLSGKGCARCAGTKKKTHEQFVLQMAERHPDIEVLGKYKNNREKVRCRCSKCNGIFMGIPHAMIDSWHGCPHCVSSNGEKAIHIWLTRHDIPHFVEQTFSDCRHKNPLPFDFYLPDHSTIIEYDGRQHFEASDYFGGEAAFETLQLHDEIKTNYCKKNNLNLIRIPYWDFKNIDSILTNALTS